MPQKSAPAKIKYKVKNVFPFGEVLVPDIKKKLNVTKKIYKPSMKWSTGEAQGVLDYGKELGYNLGKKERDELFQQVLHWKDLAIRYEKELAPYRRKKLKEISKIKVTK
jgi:hypothetical protein